MKKQNKIACYGKWKCRGGRTIHGYEEGKIERATKPDGTIYIRRYPPVAVTIRIFHDETWISKNETNPGGGYFEIDNTEHNLTVLRDHIRLGKVELEDLDLQNEIMGKQKIDKLHTIYEDVVSTVEMVNPPTPFNKKKNVSSAKKEAGLKNIKKAQAGAAAARERRKAEKEAAELAELETIG
jgi:hypothetical protein